MGKGRSVEEWDNWTTQLKTKGYNGNGHGASLHVEVLRFLPTPNTMDTLPPRSAETIAERKKQTPAGYANLRETVVNEVPDWDKYEPVIKRWEKVIGRSAPTPTSFNEKTELQSLNPKFTEWLMGLPDGWITDCDLTRNEQLKACGNGVVPQQAELALRVLIEDTPELHALFKETMTQ